MSEPGWGEDETTLSIKKNDQTRAQTESASEYISTPRGGRHELILQQTEEERRREARGNYTALSGGAAFRRGTEGTSHQNDVAEPSNSQVFSSASHSLGLGTHPQSSSRPRYSDGLCVCHEPFPGAHWRQTKFAARI